MAYQRLLLSIADDEYAYASLGLVHSNVIITKISNYELLRELKVHQIYHLVSLFIVLGAGFYFYLLKILFEKKVFLQVAILILTVVFLRYFIFRFGGNPFAHPPLVGISSLISVAIFGLTDLSLKFIPFLIYNLFAIYYFFKLIKFNNKLTSFLIAISLFSIPGILYIGTAVEQSLYSIICFSIISIELINNNEPNYKKLSSMHFYGWKKGLKTGMYYLRSQSVVQAQKFSVDISVEKNKTKKSIMACSRDNPNCDSCGA